jgi:UDP-MurNAc hydroxylase
VLLPEYPTSQLEDELRALGFTSFFKTKSNEVHELDGGLKVMIQALISPTDGPIGDSSLGWSTTASGLLNQNDARPTDLSTFAELGTCTRTCCSSPARSGIRWSTSCPGRQDRVRQAEARPQFDRTWRYIDDLKADHVFPIAGPPCFLDDELWQFNDISATRATSSPTSRSS